jgi:hypothetical protein
MVYLEMGYGTKLLDPEVRSGVSKRPQPSFPTLYESLQVKTENAKKEARLTKLSPKVPKRMFAVQA